MKWMTSFLGLFIGVCSAAQAQNWPDKPIRVIVPGPAGSVTDLLARAMSESLRTQLGQPIVVENKPGANQMIAAEACANARPDGYTFCITAPEPHANNLFLFKKLPYDPVHGFAPVVQLTTHTALILASANIQGRTLTEIASGSKARPGTYNWASFGQNSISHVYLEAIRSKTGWDVTHVPYKSSLEARMALVTNEAQLAFLLVDGAVREQLAAGKLQPLVFAGKRRAPDFPQVPTLEEVGMKDIYIPGWFGVLAPAGTPEPVVQRMNQASMVAMRSPPVQPILPLIGNGRADDNSPAEFAATIRESREAARIAVKSLNIEPQ